MSSTYVEVCIGREVSQYHDNERYILGKWLLLGGVNSVSHIDSGRYEGKTDRGVTEQSFVNGAPCEQKGNRKATVQYECSDTVALGVVGLVM